MTPKRPAVGAIPPSWQDRRDQPGSPDYTDHSRLLSIARCLRACDQRLNDYSLSKQFHRETNRDPDPALVERVLKAEGGELD